MLLVKINSDKNQKNKQGEFHFLSKNNKTNLTYH